MLWLTAHDLQLTAFHQEAYNDIFKAATDHHGHQSVLRGLNIWHFVLSKKGLQGKFFIRRFLGVFALQTGVVLCD